MLQSTVNAASNYNSRVIAYNKLMMRPGISRHAITFLSFFKARSLQHSNISSKATHDEYLPISPALPNLLSGVIFLSHHPGLVRAPISCLEPSHAEQAVL